MQLIVSPAKQMRIARDTFEPQGIPPFPHKTAQVQTALEELVATHGRAALQALWKVSDKLFDENLETLTSFITVLDSSELERPSVSARSSAALFSYHGIQFRSMAPEVLNEAQLNWIEDHLWILSGLYGCIRPFDAIQPYRLEMGARLSLQGAQNLYAFWGKTLGDHLGSCACADDGWLVNLASAEYHKAVLPYLPAKVQVLTCVFAEDLKDGKPVVRATASKIARGSMVRWLAEHPQTLPENLKNFDVGYCVDPRLSHRSDNHHTLVFIRDTQAS